MFNTTQVGFTYKYPSKGKLLYIAVHHLERLFCCAKSKNSKLCVGMFVISVKGRIQIPVYYDHNHVTYFHTRTEKTI
jgi:hypothetical protein